MLFPFVMLVAIFNAFSSVLTQVLVPHGFTNTDSGIAGAILIAAGLAASAIISPLMDKFGIHLPVIKFEVPLLALSYFLMIWAPSSGALVFVYVISGLIGAFSFSLLPVGLEFVADITVPVSPEFSSALIWAGGQVLGATLLSCVGFLKAGDDSSTPGNLDNALILFASIAAASVPFVMSLGFFGRQDRVLRRRGMEG